MSQATAPTGSYLNSNLFSGYYLDERLSDLDAWNCDVEARETFDELRELWANERALVGSYKEDELLGAWISKVLDTLGFDTIAEPTLPDGGGYVDRLLFESVEARRGAAERKLHDDDEGLFNRACCLLEAKQWNTDFSKRFSEDRQYRDASHQVKFYLERTPEDLQWGILTDGRTWRLYGTKEYETQTYYEVDLPELLDSGDLQAFKYFYLFFRPAAFVETARTTFLDRVWNESETAAQELGEDLQNNVFTALRVLGKGFVETNSLKIDPEDEAARSELKEQSLVLLYRLMFVLYAESRGLIDPDDPTRKAEYDEHFSLDSTRLEILETVDSGESFETEYSGFSTAIWDRLTRLFELIDVGNADLGIPPYNGGLFDGGEHEFLEENGVSDPYIAEVIYRLSTTQTDDGFVLADYADLDTRHLGTIYEGLLEHVFRIAPEEGMAAVSENGGEIWKPATEVSVADAIETVDAGGLYVVNDEGERKATGAYYTPDYVVTYIVEETIDPLVAEIREDLDSRELTPGTEAYVTAFWHRVRELKVLDPAMGSGHFLTRATGYLAEAMMEEVRKLETATLFSEEGIRREISKECIYGVDLNGMAVELAKLSMWLETLAADQPLAFLDHHLKTGNSLVGSDISEVLSDEGSETGQLTFAQVFARTRKRALDHVMDLMGELLAFDNETLSDIKSMEGIYEEIRADPLYGRLFAMANVHTAEAFGLDVPAEAIEQMARAIEDEGEWDGIEGEDWFRTAQAMGDEEDFFHWELEFPEVFFDTDGERMEGAGFDAVVGNPPYLGTKHLETQQKEYYKNKYHSSTGKWDVYCLFTERGIQVTRRKLGYIQPTMFMRRVYGEGLREYISESSANVESIIDLANISVFEGATNYVGILLLDHGGTEDEFEVLPLKENIGLLQDRTIDGYLLRNSDLTEEPWPVIPPTVKKLVDNTPNSFVELRQITTTISEGIKTGHNDVFVLEQSEAKDKGIEKGITKTFLKGKDIKRYAHSSTDLVCIYPYMDGSRIEEKRLSEEYPVAYKHLKEFKSDLESRPSVGPEKREWYELEREREPEIYQSPKILSPDISSHNNFAIDEDENHYFNTKVKSIRLQDNQPIEYKELLGLLNSAVLEYVYRGISPPKRGGYRAYKPAVLSQLQIPTERVEKSIAEYVENILNSKRELETLNLDLLDYLGNYEDGPTLGEMGYQPPSGLADSILTETAESTAFETLRVTEARVEREGGDLRVLAVPYVKPADEAEYETNNRGYATLEPVPAMKFFGLSDAQADLVEAFVPYAVAEADGFAGYRDNATATIPPLDRLESLSLPKLADVESGVERYMDARERAMELDAKIERTDELIDEIVYELYGLTDEEVEIVKEAVGD